MKTFYYPQAFQPRTEANNFVSSIIFSHILNHGFNLFQVIRFRQSIMDDLEIDEHHDHAAIRTKCENESQPRAPTALMADGRIFTALSDDEDEMLHATTRTLSNGKIEYSVSIDKKGTMKMSRSDGNISGHAGSSSKASRTSCWMCRAEKQGSIVAKDTDTLAGSLKERDQQKSGDKMNSDQMIKKRSNKGCYMCRAERMASATDTATSSKTAQRVQKCSSPTSVHEHRDGVREDEQDDKKRNLDLIETSWSEAEKLGTEEETKSNQSKLIKHGHSSIKSKESLEYISDNQVHQYPSPRKVNVQSPEDCSVGRRTTDVDAASSTMKSPRRGRDLQTCTLTDFAEDVMPIVDM